MRKIVAPAVFGYNYKRILQLLVFAEARAASNDAAANSYSTIARVSAF